MYILGDFNFDNPGRCCHFVSIFQSSSVFRDSKPSPKKNFTPKKDKKDVDKETPIKGTPKVSKSEEVVEVPPSLEKKKIWLP